MFERSYSIHFIIITSHFSSYATMWVQELYSETIAPQRWILYLNQEIYVWYLFLKVISKKHEC